MAEQLITHTHSIKLSMDSLVRFSYYATLSAVGYLHMQSMCDVLQFMLQFLGQLFVKNGRSDFILWNYEAYAVGKTKLRLMF